MNFQNLFSEKKKKKYFNVSFTENYNQHAKRWNKNTILNNVETTRHMQTSIKHLMELL